VGGCYNGSVTDDTYSIWILHSLFSSKSSQTSHPTEEAECYAFSPVVGIGTPPTPHPQAIVPPPPPRFWGEGHTRWREKGLESPNSDDGTYTVVLFIYTNFVSHPHQIGRTNTTFPVPVSDSLSLGRAHAS
jgi:hypothetical protein